MISRFLNRLAVIPAAIGCLIGASELWGNQDAWMAAVLGLMVAGVLMALAWVFKPY